jgi:DNA recombination protein RmuC
MYSLITVLVIIFLLLLNVAGIITVIYLLLNRISKMIHEEIINSFQVFSGFFDNQNRNFENFSKKLDDLMDKNERRMEQIRDTVDKRLEMIQNDNTQKLEEMRKIVDEKLNATLEKRLGESFRLVSERLEMVHRGLGEMKNLASDVGDLKKVLANVKTRGVWGEIQLGNLLDQILSPEQYERNVITKEGSKERVEYVIKLPGRNENKVVYLPIDAKFPQESYQRLLDAYDSGNIELIEEARKDLEITIKNAAKDIQQKYLDPPNTTDFGIMFLPYEGLYAEVLRIPGLVEYIQKNNRITITGPTTLAAFLNSLQMGFRTLAIEKRSSEVWTLLSTVKTEFNRFGDLLQKTHKKLQEASDTIESAVEKSKTIKRKLENVQMLPEIGSKDEKMLEAPLDENAT